MVRGTIVKALSGFYYVDTAEGLLTCKARGRFRLDGTSPLVGDKALCLVEDSGAGRIEALEPRKNWFIRPAVANVDALVFIAANTTPVTDPFLIDRVSVIAQDEGCELIVCINKCDLDPGDALYEAYSLAGISVVRTSAVTGEGLAELSALLAGKVCAFTGNSGVGKSSLLNALIPGARIQTGDVSEKLGRGRHTTRHVELYAMPGGALAADTPGFASFDVELVKPIPKERLQYDFLEFSPYIGACRFHDCAHLKEPDCAVRAAVDSGRIAPGRYQSYLCLYELSAQQKSWELRQSDGRP